jgi:hypothetical protein
MRNAVYIDSYNTEGDTIKDLKNHRPNYSKEQVAEALEIATIKRIAKEVEKIENNLIQ